MTQPQPDPELSKKYMSIITEAVQRYAKSARQDEKSGLQVPHSSGDIQRVEGILQFMDGLDLGGLSNVADLLNGVSKTIKKRNT